MIGVDPTVLGLFVFASLLGVCGLFWAAAVLLSRIAKRLGWVR